MVQIIWSVIMAIVICSVIGLWVFIGRERKKMKNLPLFENKPQWHTRETKNTQSSSEPVLSLPTLVSTYELNVNQNLQTVVIQGDALLEELHTLKKMGLKQPDEGFEPK